MFAEKVNSVEELRVLAQNTNGVACFIYLDCNGRSSKHVWFSRNRFRVFAEIDGSEESATVSEFGKLGSGLLLDAIERGAFYRYL